jgi:tRNA(Ile)-lysidine synthase
MREAQGLLDELAALDLVTAAEPAGYAWLGLPSLSLGSLRHLSEARQRNALRHWLAPLTALPDSEHWAGWRNLRDAAVDSAAVWCLALGELRRADERLWWLAGEWLQAPLAPGVWSEPKQMLQLPGNGQLSLHGQCPVGELQVRYRTGGEVLVLPGRGHRDLKRLLNERGVPAFVRGRLPLLYRGEELLAVANLPGLDGSQWGDWQLLWQPPTSEQGLS